MKISFELSDRDLDFFRKALKQSREAVRDADESEIIEAISDVLNEIRKNEPLPDTEREQLLAAFVYFADPEDILPDDIPVIGYLDDVIIIEHVVRELHHVRIAYDDFCQYREEFEKKLGKDVAPVIRRDRLDRRRQQLHQRMHRRTSRQKKSQLW